ncbi:MAG: D-proline reductase (dithiol) protein PrdB [Aristaeellaceae bacterium]
MKLTTVEGMQSEIFVPVTPPPVFTELKKPLSECRVAFITAGGIHKKSQTPFNTSGDFSYRTIEFDTPSSELMVTHGGFDNSDINKDVNAMFPIDRLHELVAEGFIGSLSRETYTFMGGGGNVEKFLNETGPEIARKLKEQGVDVVLCTGGCGTCHRSATIVTRCCEEAGMSCVVIAALPPIARQQGAPRITAPHVPIGSNAGEPNNIPMQTAIIKESLEWVRDCPSFNQMKVLPYEYRHNV